MYNLYKYIDIVIKKTPHDVKSEKLIFSQFKMTEILIMSTDLTYYDVIVVVPN
jgi:hypothetical protein